MAPSLEVGWGTSAPSFSPTLVPIRRHPAAMIHHHLQSA